MLLGYMQVCIDTQRFEDAALYRQVLGMLRDADTKAEGLRGLKNGDEVLVPVNKKQAELMVILGQEYLQKHPPEPL